MQALGLYLHLPFCLNKCPYCDFVSGATWDAGTVRNYVKALRQEAEIYQKQWGPFQIKSLYIGGGTPTCLSLAQLEYLGSELSAVFTLPVDGEITVEANPGTLSPEKLCLLRKLGCNRLSLGVQSFRSQDLRVLGRHYTPGEIFQAFWWARQAGFRNLSLDLMFGLPGQSLTDWQANLTQAVALGPQHIALYQLSVEPGTLWATWVQRGLLAEFPEETAYLMAQRAQCYLKTQGFEHYELSSFALPGYQAVHNSLYWLNEVYLGLGVGASGYLQKIRYTNTANLKDYLNFLKQGKLPRVFQEEITRELAMAETMFLGLRFLKGVSKARFWQKHGQVLTKKYAPELKKLKEQGLLQETETHILLTPRGVPLANLVFQEFLEESKWGIGRGALF